MDRVFTESVWMVGLQEVERGVCCVGRNGVFAGARRGWRGVITGHRNYLSYEIWALCVFVAFS